MDYLLLFAGIFAVGVFAQWIAWRLSVPSILLLLLAGLTAGPWTGTLDPDLLLGDALFPLVSLSVAIILFEGGLTLQLGELKELKSSIWRLISVGVLVTWIIGAAAAHWILGWGWDLSILLGALLTVSGPTVVGPLLRLVRPSGKIGSLAKWEGIMNDPVGALLAVVMYEVIREGHMDAAGGSVLLALTKTILAGGLIGWLGAQATLFAFRKHWVPDHLEGPVTLVMALLVFAGANLVQHEAGLFAVTLAGVAMANQHHVHIKHIVEFKENLRVILISTLFILLAARIEPSALADVGWREFGFLAVLILIARPLAVELSTVGTDLTRKEKFFLSCLAPRGIVAAAVSAVFAFGLEDAGFEGAERLASMTFLVIITTVAVYGLAALPLGRWLGISQEPRGVLFVGAHAWAREVASALAAEDVPVCLVDTNRQNVNTARMQGLPTVYGNALSEQGLQELDLSQLAHCVAVTANDELNSLAARHFSEDMGRGNVYQIPPEIEDGERVDSLSREVRAPLLFHSEATYHEIIDRKALGAVVKRTNLTTEFDYTKFLEMYGESAWPMFVIRDGQVKIVRASQPHQPDPGSVLISLVDGEPEA